MKPSDFFIGVQDLFAILLPGAGLAFIAMFWAALVDIPSDHVLHALLSLNGAGAWAAFFVTAYVLGHLVASMGSKLDTLYDRRKGVVRNQALMKVVDRALEMFLVQVAPSVEGTPKSPDPTKPVARQPAWWLKPINAVLVRGTWGTEPRRRQTAVDEEEGVEKPINAYKLARITLQTRAPAVFTEVARQEADSKFFRSLVIVAVFALAACTIQVFHDLWLYIQHEAPWGRPVWGGIYFVFVLLALRSSFSRFCELRLKATETAFQAMIVLDKRPAPVSNGTPSTDEDDG
jgi:hypothetical protein